METEHREKKDNNNIVTIKNKTKNTSNLFSLVQGICELSGNEIIHSDENLISVKVRK